MKFAIATLAAVFVCCPGIGFAGCSGSDFGRTATLTCDRTAKNCLLQRKFMPTQIRNIKKGAAMTWIGFLNGGPVTYVALDISNQRALKIQTYCPSNWNPPSPPPPQIKSPTPYNYEKTVQGCVEHIQIIPLSARQVSELECPLNPLWSTSFKPYEQMATDIGATIWLLLPHRAKEGMALGYFTGPVGNFGKALLQLFAGRLSPSVDKTHPAMSQ